MIFDEDGKTYYRRLPAGMPKADYERLKKIRSRNIIDTYIDLVVHLSTYDWSSVKKLDELIEKNLKIICKLRMVRFEDEVPAKIKERNIPRF